MRISLTSHSYSTHVTAHTFHGASGSIVTFEGDGGDLQIHCPPHVAEATAKAFNEAMAITAKTEDAA